MDFVERFNLFSTLRELTRKRRIFAFEKDTFSEKLLDDDVTL